MPRDGSNIYHYPTAIEGIPNQPIESADYNSFLTDVQQDLNLARPIIAGGTGATSAAGALAALGGEQAGQVVTNYDSFAFAAGSFYSAIGATSAPNGSNSFRGIAVVTDSNNLHIQARDNVTGIAYIRYKNSGTWGAWTIDGSTNFVELTGDTMTGSLTVSATNPVISLNKSAASGTNAFNGSNGGLSRWAVIPGDPAAESGSNAGSNFGIYRYNDAGTFISSSLSIARSSGIATFESNIVTTGSVVAGQNFVSSTSAVVLAPSPSGGVYLRPNGAASALNEVNVNPAGVVSATALSLVGALSAGSAAIAGGATFGGTIEATGRRGRQGLSGSYNSNYHNWFFSGGATRLWVDNTDFGPITVTSDYRTKKDVVALPSTWETVKRLKPIKYTHRDFSPPSHKDNKPLFTGDNIERWGFLAHELQEATVISAATGVKDAPDVIQSPDPFTIISALTKALQEAMARIEALEAR